MCVCVCGVCVCVCVCGVCVCVILFGSNPAPSEYKGSALSVCHVSPVVLRNGRERERTD